MNKLKAILGIIMGDGVYFYCKGWRYCEDIKVGDARAIIEDLQVLIDQNIAVYETERILNPADNGVK